MCERNKTRLQPFKDNEVLRRLIRLPLEVDGRVQKEVEERLKKKEKKGKLPTMQSGRPRARRRGERRASWFWRRSR
jgi:hypothetical protein